MIAKGLEKPIIFYRYDAALRRVIKQHIYYDKIEKDYARRKAGFSGEQSLNYYLSFLPQKDYVILQDIRLRNGQFYFQIDNLILTPNYYLVVEIKHISGTIYYDHTFKQFIRSHHQHEDYMANPILQVERQSQQLKIWLEAHRIEPAPIKNLVLFGNNSIFKTSTFKQEVISRIGHTEQLITFINEFDKSYTHPTISTKLANKIARLIRKHHEPLVHDFCTNYHITATDIIRGVQCPHCLAIPMSRIKGKWYCSTCGNSSINAHEQAVMDYFYLIKDTITNRECCDFLDLHSPRLAHKILQSMNLPCNGKTKGTVYFPPSN